MSEGGHINFRKDDARPDLGQKEAERQVRTRLFGEADNPADLFNLASDLCGWDLEKQRNRLFAYIRDHTRDQADVHCLRLWLHKRVETEIQERD